jgi:hypothetical protein
MKLSPSRGYDVHQRKLVVNQEEARTVRDIFERYPELLGTLVPLNSFGCCELTRDPGEFFKHFPSLGARKPTGFGGAD